MRHTRPKGLLFLHVLLQTSRVRGGEVLQKFLGEDVPLGPWNP